jgi:large repetitive protein
MATRKHLSALPLLVAALLACLPASAFAAELKEQTVEITSTAPSNAKVEGPTYTVTAIASSGLPVELSSANPEHCSLSSSSSGAKVSFIGAGPCTIAANQAGSSEYKKAKQVTQIFEVAKGTQTIKFTSTAPSHATVGGSQYIVRTQGGVVEAVKLTIDAASATVCSLPANAKSEASVSFIGVGTCTIDANVEGNPNYEPAPMAQQSFAVKKTQTIEVEPPKSTFAGTSYTAEAKASTGPPVETATLSSAICTVAGLTVSLIKPGTCTLRFSWNGNSEYEPAQYTQTFQVVKGTVAQAITFTSLPPEPTLIGFNYEVRAKGGESGNRVTFSIDPPSASICSISGSIVTFLAGGTCTIDANQAGNETYAPAPTAQQQVTVTRNAQAIEFTSSSPAPALVGNTYAISAVASSTLPVTFSPATPSVCTVSGSTVKLVSAGTCTINADQGGNAQWAPAPQRQQSFAVSIVVTPGPPNAKSGGTSGTLPSKTVSANSNFKVVAASLSLANYSITFVEAVNDPGTFKWVLTFENGKFGEYGASVKAKKCKAGWLKLKRRCRPARVLFGQGHRTVTGTGSVTFTVRPTKAGVAALRKAFKLNKGLPVSAHVTYQSIHGGSPVARVQSLIVKGKR